MNKQQLTTEQLKPADLPNGMDKWDHLELDFIDDVNLTPSKEEKKLMGIIEEKVNFLKEARKHIHEENAKAVANHQFRVAMIDDPPIYNRRRDMAVTALSRAQFNGFDDYSKTLKFLDEHLEQGKKKDATNTLLSKVAD